MTEFQTIEGFVECLKQNPKINVYVYNIKQKIIWSKNNTYLLVINRNNRVFVSVFEPSKEGLNTFEEVVGIPNLNENEVDYAFVVIEKA